MAGRLSFSIAVNLLTENFKKGASSMQSSLKSIQMQVLTFAAALGAGGLSISGFVSSLVQTARETSRVTTALKNVSGSLANFANNQRFVIDLAGKYGIEVLALTSNFSKFTAAASNAGMAMSDQKKIFEAVSRASTAFSLSAEDTNLTFLAITQMMSKGKISSEELRRQLGERLPIAMAAMAKAAGVPIQKLDKLLQQGKLMSADVLPKFADALNNMIPNVSTDNVETSINRLKNAFTEFTKGTGVQDAFKSLVDSMTKAVQYAAENIKAIVSEVSAFVIGVGLGKMFKWILTQLAISQKAAMAAASKAAKAAGESFDAATWKAKSGAATMSAAFGKAATTIKAAFMSMLPTAILIVISEVIAKIIYLGQEANRIKNIFSDYQSEASRASNTTEVAKLQTLYKIATDTNKVLASRQYALNELNKQLGTAYSIDSKTLSIQGDINAKYAERVKLLKAAAEVDFYTTKKLETQDKLDALKRSSKKEQSVIDSTVKYKETSATPTFWEATKNALNPKSMLATWKAYNPFNGAKQTISNNDSEAAQLNLVLSDVTKKLEAAMSIAPSTEIKAQDYTPDAEKTKQTELQKAEEKYKEQLNELNAQLELNKQSAGTLGLSQSEYNKALDELNIKTLVDAKGTGDKAILNSQYLKTLEAAVKKPLYNKAQGELEEVQKKYVEQVKTLTGQYETTALTEKQYKAELAKLADETVTAAGSIQDVGLAGKSFIAGLKFSSSMLTARTTVTPKTRDTTSDYDKTRSEITGEKLDIAKDYVDALKEQLQSQIGDLMVELDKAIEDKDFSKALKIAETKVELKGLATAIKDVEGLDKAMELDKVQERIKDLNKELGEGLYSGIKDIASSSDRVVSAFSNLSEVFSDVDSSGWERIMAVWNAMTTTLDAFMSIISIIETITEVTDKLAKAKEVEATIDTTTTGIKVANAAEGATAKVAATATEVTADATKVKANTAVAASGAAASVSSIPIVGIALAIGAFATIMALMGSLPKFATGGIMPKTGDKMLARINPGEMILNEGQQRKLFGMINSGIPKVTDFSKIQEYPTSVTSSLSTTKVEVSLGGSTRVRGSDLILSINNELKRRGKKTVG